MNSESALVVWLLLFALGALALLSGLAGMAAAGGDVNSRRVNADQSAHPARHFLYYSAQTWYNGAVNK